MIVAARTLANVLMAVLMLFLIHRYFIFWQDWPDFSTSLTQLLSSPNDKSDTRSTLVLIAYAVVLVLVVLYSFSRKSQSLLIDAERYSSWSAFVIRFAFWAVFLIGIADTAISALRVENILVNVIGPSADTKLGLAKLRGLYVHYPLLIVALIIAALTRGLSFIWLTVLVVLAEFSIVITRFVFSYEQAYMGDLVRFWYAALFLFASAYTLIEEGHVRVDVLYANMRKRSKAWVNALGSLLLGIPFCLTILIMGLESKQSSLASPIITFEISQSGYGLFVKYLMAGFLAIFAISMMIQFISYFLNSVAVLLGDKNAKIATAEMH